MIPRIISTGIPQMSRQPCPLNVRITPESGHPADIDTVPKVQVIAALRVSGFME
jgi:hypothetical protein